MEYSVRKVALPFWLAGVVTSVLLVPGAILGQGDARELAAVMCGPFCAYQVAKAHGIDVTLAEIQNLTGHDLHAGTSITGLIDGLRRLGIITEVREASLTDLANDPRIPIAYLQYASPTGPTGHFVLVDLVHDGYVRVLDGAELNNMSENVFSEHWTGVVIFAGNIVGAEHKLNWPIAGSMVGGLVSGIGLTSIGWLALSRGRKRKDRPLPDLSTSLP